MWRARRQFLSAICFAATAYAAHAAEFSVQSNENTATCNIRLAGPIINGDLERLKTSLTHIRPGYRLGQDALQNLTLCLHSPGGAYQEGLRIARFLIEEHLSTYIEANAHCYSACAIIFMAGGYQFEGIHLPRRTLHVAGALGFHAPYIKNVQERNYSSSELEGVYQESVKAIRDLMQLGRGARVGANFMPKAIIAEMLDKRPNELFLVDTLFKAHHTAIDIDGWSLLPLLPEQAYCNVCETFFSDPGVSIALDKPPNTCRATSTVKRGGELLFEGYGFADSNGYCVVRPAKRTEAFLQVYSNVVSINQRRQADKFVSLPVWSALPPNTPIRNLK